ncbi:8774_t:CDS:2, partial [Racocetra fulgida]
MPVQVITQAYDIEAAAVSSLDGYDINIDENPNKAYDVEAAANSSPDETMTNNKNISVINDEE